MARKPMTLLTVGSKFCRWTVVGPPLKGAHHKLYPCCCQCGTNRNVKAANLIAGSTKSCGCYKRDNPPNVTHGCSPRRGETPEYAAWSKMKRRCYSPRDSRYSRYGARGIRVCDAWLESFQTFLTDVGLRPSRRHSIDRINNDGHYEPGNVKWSTDREQANNTRRTHLLTHEGVTLSIAEWSRRMNVSPWRILRGIKLGWPMEKMLHR